MSDTIDSTILSNLYIACENGDRDTVERLLPKLTLDEVNQIESNGNTSLHAACQSEQPEIVKLLLGYGVLRTIKNIDGCIPYDVATTDEVKQLFHRSFVDAQARFSSDNLPDQSIEWVNTEYGHFGWWSKECLYNTDINLAIIGIIKNVDLQDICSTHKIEYFFKKARQTEDPEWLVRIYSAGISFCQILNKAIALGPSIIKSLPKGDDFYSYIGILSHHDGLKCYRYTGTCYRGIKLSVTEFEKNYRIGQIYVIKPFMSTSKSRSIAEQFARVSSNEVSLLSVLCIYTVPEHTLSFKDNVALDISTISEYPHEEEVLILPYTSLKIQDIKRLSCELVEIEMQWYRYNEDPNCLQNFNTLCDLTSDVFKYR